MQTKDKEKIEEMIKYEIEDYVITQQMKRREYEEQKAHDILICLALTAILVLPVVAVCFLLSYIGGLEIGFILVCLAAAYIYMYNGIREDDV